MLAELLTGVFGLVVALVRHDSPDTQVRRGSLPSPGVTSVRVGFGDWGGMDKEQARAAGDMTSSNPVAIVCVARVCMARAGNRVGGPAGPPQPYSAGREKQASSCVLAYTRASSWLVGAGAA
jgi:hypothetical protein